MLVDHLKEDIFRYNSSMPRLLFKLSLFAILVFTFFLVTLPSLTIYFIHQKTGRYILAKIVSLHSTICLKIFNIGLSVIGKSNIDKNGALLVSNHMSYVDILCLASIYHTQFVTSLEMKETPFLGHIAQAAGCVFVDRKSKNKREKELRDLVETLSSGGLVTIFPEATSTNGDDVLRFRHGYKLIDSPNTTSSTTYKLQGAIGWGGYLYLNKTDNTSETPKSNIILTEVAA